MWPQRKHFDRGDRLASLILTCRSRWRHVLAMSYFAFVAWIVIRRVRLKQNAA
jgi:hypothetical protein